ncbi:hypothetical protein OHA21_08570 [Actinoplanes sp. NBC_00393]|uniref:hypothetical protein n=1 Tax=Actinoplanes sp. NBC_00393 TaxID=2975953 RepID=UPI002E242657
MRTSTFRSAAVLAAALIVGGCSAPAASPPSPPPSAAPSASAETPVRFSVPAKIDGLPRTTAKKWTRIAASRTDFLERHVLRPLDTLTAVYVDADKPGTSVDVSAVTGRVADPAVQLGLLTRNQLDEWADGRPADPGVAGGVGTCAVSRKQRPLIGTRCHWAEPGSVGTITIWSDGERRKDFAGIVALIQPAG